MIRYLWSRNGWGSDEIPDNVDEIIEKANEAILAYAANNPGADVKEYSERLWNVYCLIGEIPRRICV